jgi:hypothetical protein
LTAALPFSLFILFFDYFFAHSFFFFAGQQLFPSFLFGGWVEGIAVMDGHTVCCV